jgi:hypothetical protein
MVSVLGITVSDEKPASCFFFCSGGDFASSSTTPCISHSYFESPKKKSTFSGAKDGESLLAYIERPLAHISLARSPSHSSRIRHASWPSSPQNFCALRAFAESLSPRLGGESIFSLPPPRFHLEPSLSPVPEPTHPPYLHSGARYGHITCWTNGRNAYAYATQPLAQPCRGKYLAHSICLPVPQASWRAPQFRNWLPEYRCKINISTPVMPLVPVRRPWGPPIPRVTLTDVATARRRNLFLLPHPQLHDGVAQE